MTQYGTDPKGIGTEDRESETKLNRQEFFWKYVSKVIETQLLQVLGEMKYLSISSCDIISLCTVSLMLYLLGFEYISQKSESGSNSTKPDQFTATSLPRDEKGQNHSLAWSWECFFWFTVSPDESDRFYLFGLSSHRSVPGLGGRVHLWCRKRCVRDEKIEFVRPVVHRCHTSRWESFRLIYTNIWTQRSSSIPRIREWLE